MRAHCRSECETRQTTTSLARVLAVLRTRRVVAVAAAVGRYKEEVVEWSLDWCGRSEGPPSGGAAWVTCIAVAVERANIDTHIIRRPRLRFDADCDAQISTEDLAPCSSKESRGGRRPSSVRYVGSLTQRGPHPHHKNYRSQQRMRWEGPPKRPVLRKPLPWREQQGEVLWRTRSAPSPPIATFFFILLYFSSLSLSSLKHRGTMRLFTYDSSSHTFHHCFLCFVRGRRNNNDTTATRMRDKQTFEIGTI